MKPSHLWGAVCASIFLLVLGVLTPAQAALVNLPPIANAGPDQTMFLTESTLLQGSAIDPDGDSIDAWEWTIVQLPTESSPTFLPTTSPTPTFVPDLLGDYVFELIASDGIAGFGLPDYTTVHVIENLPPIAIAFADVTSGPGPLTVNFDGSGSYDPEGGPLTYGWDFGGGSPTSNEVSPTHTFPYATGNPYTLTVGLVVIDDWGQAGETTLTINVNAVPVPASVWLFGTGLLGLVGIARRKKA